jgi:hypothetical protein
LLTIATAVYLAGVLWALVRSDATPLGRVVLALAWPLGPIAFAVTLVILFLAAHVAFPLFGAISMMAAVAVWWRFG